MRSWAALQSLRFVIYSLSEQPNTRVNIRCKWDKDIHAELATSSRVKGLVRFASIYSSAIMRLRNRCIQPPPFPMSSSLSKS